MCVIIPYYSFSCHNSPLALCLSCVSSDSFAPLAFIIPTRLAYSVTDRSVGSLPQPPASSSSGGGGGSSGVSFAPGPSAVSEEHRVW